MGETGEGTGLSGELNNAFPQDVRIPILRTRGCNLRGKRDFADAIKVRILRGGEYPGWSRWVQENRDFYKRRCRRIREETGDVVMKVRGRNDAGMWEASGSWKRQGDNSPLEP